MATVAVVVVTEVILRYGAGTSLIITEELSRYGMIWVALLASVLVLREEGHIATGAGGWLGPRGQRALRVVAELLSLLFLIVLAVAGLQVLPAQRDQDTLTLGVTIFWFYLALPVSALLMAVVITAMLRQGYPGGFVSSVIAGSAVMGPIIPPSVAMLIYAYVYGGGISVGKLFLMGVVPGVLVAVALMALVWVSARQRHFPKSDTKFSLGGIVRSLRGALLGLVVPVIILGGILGGVFTPTEAGAVAALYAVLIGVVVLRTLGLRELGQSLLVGAKTSAIIYLLLGTSNVVSWILVRHQVPKIVAQWSLELTDSATVFIIVTITVLFLLGLALEPVPIMIMLIPVLAPAAAAYRIDPHHLGLIIVMTVQTALLSPPVALSLYVVATVIRCPMREANREEIG